MPTPEKRREQVMEHLAKVFDIPVEELRRPMPWDAAREQADVERLAIAATVHKMIEDYSAAMVELQAMFEETEATMRHAIAILTLLRRLHEERRLRWFAHYDPSQPASNMMAAVAIRNVGGSAFTLRLDLDADEREALTKLLRLS